MAAFLKKKETQIHKIFILQMVSPKANQLYCLERFFFFGAPVLWNMGSWFFWKAKELLPVCHCEFRVSLQELLPFLDLNACPCY